MIEIVSGEPRFGRFPTLVVQEHELLVSVDLHQFVYLMYPSLGSDWSRILRPVSLFTFEHIIDAIIFPPEIEADEH